MCIRDRSSRIYDKREQHTHTHTQYATRNQKSKKKRHSQSASQKTPQQYKVNHIRQRSMSFFGIDFGFPAQHYGGHRRLPPPPPIALTLRAYPAVFIGREDLEKGNKILLPSSVLGNLSNYQVPTPMIFGLTNIVIGTHTNVGVLEFLSEEGTCHLPNWLFTNLHLEEGSFVNLTLITDMPKGRYVKIRPHESAFIELPDPRAILEMQLRNYTCLTQGDTINIQFNDRNYFVDILEAKPQSMYNAVCVIEADVEVDFAPPLDYVEDAVPLNKKQSSIRLDDDETAKRSPGKKPKEPENKLFGGKGVRLDGKAVDHNKLAQADAKKIIEENYDPRKHRLPHGVRQYIYEDIKGKSMVIGGETMAPEPKKPVAQPQPPAPAKLNATTTPVPIGSDSINPAKLAVKLDTSKPEVRPEYPELSKKNTASGTMAGGATLGSSGVTISSGLSIGSNTAPLTKAPSTKMEEEKIMMADTKPAASTYVKQTSGVSIGSGGVALGSGATTRPGPITGVTGTGIGSTSGGSTGIGAGTTYSAGTGTSSYLSGAGTTGGLSSATYSRPGVGAPTTGGTSGLSAGASIRTGVTGGTSAGGVGTTAPRTTTGGVGGTPATQFTSGSTYSRPGATGTPLTGGVTGTGLSSVRPSGTGTTSYPSTTGTNARPGGTTGTTYPARPAPGSGAPGQPGARRQIKRELLQFVPLFLSINQSKSSTQQPLSN
eukprot:TRINITY_DN6471_c0_g1_i4.p1 TRINITY_DN6471_c0_g1~~TRINITY_DN6471_c0_g1_i4.p1  ORF type:complete len:712 (+),score=138.03 TRINITY_DN6471_c0_g1_i4:66-2201(+)